jgi:tetratricopeptide (TPR) repeat protein
MGRIVLARDLELDRDIAIKELLTASPEGNDRFEREIRITARLQHPSIIAVQEAGRWPDGVPFYAMQRVEGRGLDRAIAASTAAQRRALLPHVIAVAEAMSYAHSRNIIHRDLKPGNVLVGEFGETIVIDWGLAKELGTADLVGTSPGTNDGDAGQLTVLGEAMGTPCYMPPEQALGGALDERADVYALGAILYHVLAGQMPYAGAKSVDAVLVAVIDGPPASMETVAPDVPRELTAIVTKAMARDRESRYANAAGFAADLKRYLDGHLVSVHRYSAWQLVARWARRHRGAVAVGAVAIAVLAITAIVSVQEIRRERDSADIARVVAQKHRSEVEGLLDYMLVDLRDKLAPLGKLGMLDGVASRARDYYADVSADTLPAADARRFGRAIGNLASVQAARGELDAALAGAARALAIARRLALGDPRDASLQEDLATALSLIADVRGRRNDETEAAAATREELEIEQRLVREHPDNRGYLSKLQATLIAVGDQHLNRRQWVEALASYRSAVELCRKLVAREPTDPEWQNMLASSLSASGGVLRRQGDLAGALNMHREALAILEGAAAHQPDDTNVAYELSFEHHLLGETLTELGELDGAQRELDAAVAGFAHLVAGEPEDLDALLQLTSNQFKQARLLLRRGKLADALAGFRATQQVAEQAVGASPDDAVWRELLFATHQAIGETLGAQAQWAAAIAAQLAALAVAEEMVRTHADNVAWRGFLLDANADLGRAYAATGRLGDARRHLSRALELADELATEVPDEVGHRKTAEELRAALQHLGATSR